MADADVNKTTDVITIQQPQPMCTICIKQMLPDDDRLICHACKEYSHRTCLSMTATIYKTLKKCDQVRWYCKGKCCEALDNVMQLLNAVSHRMDQAESQVANLNLRVVTAENNLLSDPVKEMIKEEVLLVIT